MVQWLRLCTPNAGSLGSVPGQGTRFYMPQQRSHVQQLRPTTAQKIKINECFLKITFTNTIRILSEKSLLVGKLSNAWYIQAFQNFNFHLKSQMLLLTTHIVRCFL